MADDAAAAAAPEVEDVPAAEPAGLTEEGARATELDAATKLRCVAAFRARQGEFSSRRLRARCKRWRLTALRACRFDNLMRKLEKGEALEEVAEAMGDLVHEG